MATDRSGPTNAAGAAELADTLFTLMPMVADHVNDRLQEYGMTTTEFWALRSVNGPMPMKELALCMEIDPSYVTLVADRLEELGMIERQPHPTDRRVKNLVLTAKGKRFKASIPDKLWNGSTMFAALTEAERSTLIGLLMKLISSNLAAGASLTLDPMGMSADK